MYLGVIATIEAKPQHMPHVLQTLQAMLAPSRAESGCLQYDLHRDRATPHRLVMVERWRDTAALQAHLKTPHFLNMQRALDGAIDALTITELDPL